VGLERRHPRYTCAQGGVGALSGWATEKAMDWLRRGVAEQCDCLIWLKTEAWIDLLRVDPRHAELSGASVFRNGSTSRPASRSSRIS
jgi:hypothetical protein